MTMPTKKSRLSQDASLSSMTMPPQTNPLFSTILSNLSSSQQFQQQVLLTQMFLAGSITPPFNSFTSALELLNNSALLLYSQNLQSGKSEQQNQIQSSNPAVKIKHNQNSHISSSFNRNRNNYFDSNDKSTFDDDDNSPTIATTLATNKQFPKDQTSFDSDGIDLEEIRRFAKAFKLRRLALGLTQTQVGQALSVTRGPAYSQSAICRFEKLDITPKSASKIKPVLEKWMQEAEIKYGDRRLKSGRTNIHDFVNDLNTKKRKRRTSFTPDALDKLNDAFEFNSHPSSAEMSNLAQQLKYDREVIRVWFCNKRQALKNSTKKFKNSSVNEENDSTNSSVMENKLADCSNHSIPEQTDQ